MALNLMAAKLALEDMYKSGNLSVSGLFDLASRVDAKVQSVAPGSTFLLYSGGADAAAISSHLATTEANVYDIGSTAAGEFVDSPQFSKALRDAIAKEQFNTTYNDATSAQRADIDTSVGRDIYGVDGSGARVSNTSLFDIVSHSYVMENDGNWRIVAVGGVDPNSVAMQTELPALLSKSGDFLINGESRTVLTQAGSLAEQVNMAIAQSAAISEASLVNPSSSGEFLSMTTQKALQVLAAPESAALLESASATLNKLGWAGMLLSAALVAQEANAAYASGDSGKANAIIGSWVGEFAAGWAGATLASEIVGSALLPLYLTGPAGAVIAGGLTLLAGLAGGVIGSVGAGALLRKLTSGGMDPLITSLQTLFRTALRPVDPLVFDLGGSGIKTVGIDSGAHFDYNGTGFAQQTSWVTPDEGILVLDKNGDGRITGNELIGNAGTDATVAAENGFTTLASLDSNGDGKIDVQDKTFSQLRLWVDANGDGKSDPGELKTLSDLGVTSISLSYTGESVTDVNGNQHLAIGSFTTKDGKTHTMEDLWLNVDTARTINTTQVAVSTAIAALPDLAGFGNVSSLHASMALDTTGKLQSLVQSFVATTDSSQRAQIVTNLIYAWAGVAQNDPNGRDNNIYGHIIDARKIETLEAFLGQHYAANYGAGADPNPRHTDAGILSDAFDELSTYVTGQLLAQSELKDICAGVHLSIDANGKAVLDVSAMVATLSGMYQKDPAATANVVVDLSSALKSMGDFGQQVTAALRAQGSLTQSGFSGLLAALGANVIVADASHLAIRGQAGVDNILMGTDKATLYASSGRDMLVTGTGDETLYGGTGRDTFVLKSGFGKVTLNESSKIDGFNLDDVQIGSGISSAQTTAYRDQSNNLVLDFGGGSQLTITSYFASASNQPVIVFADGTKWDYTAITSSLVFADMSAGRNTLFGLNGVDNRIVGAAGDVIYGGDHNDTITVGANNTVYAGRGTDTIIVNAGSGQTILNDNYSSKNSSANQDVVKLGAGISASSTQIARDVSNNLVLNFGNGDSLKLTGYFGSSSNRPAIVFADGTKWDYTAITSSLVFADMSAGGNTLFGLNGVDNRIVGAAGDVIYGADRNDTITVGKNNTVYAGRGTDTIIVNAGSGQTILNDNYSSKNSSANQDVVKLGTGISASGTQIARDVSNNLVLNFGSGDSLKLIGYFGSSSNRPTIAFADGTNWDYTAITSSLVFADTSAGGNTLFGLNGVDNRIVGAAGDVIYGADRNDTITVGKNNTVYAGRGTDTIIVNAGSGQTILNDNYSSKNSSANQDVVKLGAGISASSTQIARDVSNNLVLNFGNGDSLKLTGYFGSGSNRPAIVFADGTTWDYTAVANNLVFTDTSTGGNTLYGLSGVDNRIVGAAADVIYGGDHNDTITAAKNSTVYAGNGNDTITVGPNNTVYAGRGTDTIIVNAGSGQTILNDNYSTKSISSNQDVVKLGAGISASSTQIARDVSNNLVLNFGSGDSLKLTGYFGSSSNRPTIAFADGTKWDYTAITSSLVFADTSAGGNTLFGLNGVDNRIVGAAGDVIYGADRNDTITVGKNNTVYAGRGTDTIIVNAGSGQTILNDNYSSKNSSANQDVVKLGAGISASSTQIARDVSNNLVLNFGNGDSLKLTGYFGSGSNRPAIVFADGTTWDYTAVANSLVFTDTSTGGNTLYGLSGVDNRIVGAAGDVIYGADRNDTITAAKNSTIYAGNGNDTITVGPNNTVYAGRGTDTIIVNAGSGQTILNDNYSSKNSSANQDVVKLGAGISASSTQIARDVSNNLVLNFGNGDSLKLTGYFGSGSNRPAIVFADGTTWDYTAVANNLVFTDTSTGGNTLYGLSGVDNRIVGATGDAIYAADHNDTITVGKNNTVYAGRGTDTIIVNAGSGQTILNDNYSSKNSSANQDVVKLGTGISASGTQIARDVSNNLVLNFGNGDSLKLTGYFGSSSNRPAIVFADGTTWDYTAVANNLVFTDTSTGGNTLYGLSGVDNRIVGATGDVIYGGDHNDTITAAKNSTIYAGYGNDTITVGPNNTVYAGRGTDTIIVNAGSGQTILNDNYSTKSISSNQDVVKLGAGISASSTQIARDLSNNLVLSFGNGDSLKLTGYFGSSSNRPTITFADGTTWDYAAVTNNLVFTDTSAGGNTLNALSGVDNRIVGAAGDAIYAADRNDTITVGKNNTVYAGRGTDTVIVNAGSGQVVLNDNYSSKSSSSNQDVVKLGAGISASATQITRDLSNNLVLNFGNGDSLKLTGYFGSGSNRPAITFADGTKWDYAAVTNSLVFADTSAGGNTLYALSGVDNRIVGATGDAIYAADHNDTITVGKNNTVYAGRGTDTVIVNTGSGQVVLNDNYSSKNSSANQDVVKLGAGISASATQVTRDLSNNLVLSFGNGDSLKLTGYFGSGSNRPAITFADGTNWDYTAITNNLVFSDTSAGGNALYALGGVDNRIVGATGDTIYGADHNDTVTVGKNNTVNAGRGADTIIVNVGSGQTVLNDNYSTKNSGQIQDVVKLGVGISASSTQVVRDLSNNLVLNFGNGDSLKLTGYFGSGSNRPVITFADGTKWDYTAVTGNLVFTDTSAGGNTLYALSGVDNRIVGATGDAIRGADHNDTITAGKNNTIYAGTGVDLFEASRGTGAVTINEATKANSSNHDTLLLNGVDTNQLWFKMSGSNLVIDMMGSTDHVTINNWTTSAAASLQTIEADNGAGGKALLGADAVSQLVQAMATFSANNPGFDPTSSSTPAITDPNVMLAVSSAWHR